MLYGIVYFIIENSEYIDNIINDIIDFYIFYIKIGKC